MTRSREILLVGEDEERLGRLRYVLVNSRPQAIGFDGRCYSVNMALNLDDAYGFLREKRYDLIICVLPVDSMFDLYSVARAIDGSIKMLAIMDEPAPVGEVYANQILYKPKAEELLSWVARMSERKRGPRPAKKII